MKLNITSDIDRNHNGKKSDETKPNENPLRPRSSDNVQTR